MTIGSSDGGDCDRIEYVNFYYQTPKEDALQLSGCVQLWRRTSLHLLLQLLGQTQFMLKSIQESIA